jgi:starch synthase
MVATAARRRSPATFPLGNRSGVPITVVHLTAEYWPLARTGGLAEAVSGLAGYQAESGTPTIVLLPFYRGVWKTAGGDLEPEGPPLAVTVGSRHEEATLFRVGRQSFGPRVYLIQNREYFDRSGIYGEGGSDYADNARRFAFFTLAALRLLPSLAPGGVVLHAHDWHTALAPVYLRAVLSGNRYYDGVATVLTVHNAGFQGHFSPEVLPDVGLPVELFDVSRMEWYGRANWLKGGLVFTDMATTVSPTHAIELRTEVGGFGLHDNFIALRDRLVGIVNGIDTHIWDPEIDPHLTARYAADDLAGKRKCKAALQRAWNLPVRSRVPLFGMSARLVSQKGLDIILGGQALREGDAQFVFLGEGEKRYEEALSEVAAAAPDRVAVNLVFTDRLEHRLLAGADFLLMPSLYEPCGLTQMRAQRYGALPLARRVGGLADTIEDEVTGFLFDEYTPAGFDRAVRRAMALFADSPAHAIHAREAMSRDFGWERSAARHLEVYRRALEARGKMGD